MQAHRVESMVKDCSCGLSAVPAPEMTRHQVDPEVHRRIVVVKLVEDDLSDVVSTVTQDHCPVGPVCSRTDRLEVSLDRSEGLRVVEVLPHLVEMLWSEWDEVQSGCRQ